MRKIRSFVRRKGRMTRQQITSIEQYWTDYGLTINQGCIADLLAGKNKPIVLEIGFGMGDSLFEQAQNHPDNFFIGIEVHRPGVGSLLNYCGSAGLNNIKVYAEDAVEVLDKCIPDDSLDKIQIFFPDPWHKKRHHKRRLIQPEFVLHCCRKLKPVGCMHVATDWQDYAEHILEILSTCASLQNTSRTNTTVPQPEDRPITKYQRRAIRLGHDIFDFVFKKRG